MSSRIERAPPALRGDLGTDEREILAEDVVPEQTRTRNAVHAKHARLPDRKIAGKHIPDGRLEQQAMRLAGKGTRGCATAEREASFQGRSLASRDRRAASQSAAISVIVRCTAAAHLTIRSEEHTSELQSPYVISY